MGICLPDMELLVIVWEEALATLNQEMLCLYRETKIEICIMIITKARKFIRVMRISKNSITTALRIGSNIPHLLQPKPLIPKKQHHENTKKKGNLYRINIIMHLTPLSENHNQECTNRKTIVFLELTTQRISVDLLRLISHLLQRDNHNKVTLFK